MKRLFAIILVLLLFAGCGAGADTTAGSDTAETTEPVSKGLYNPNSNAEKLSNGAVRAYPLGSTNYIGMASVGSKLLLISNTGELTLLTGELCEPGATMVTGTQISMDTLGFSASDTGIGYYAAGTNEVVLLNPQLQETGRYILPEEMQGMPAISAGKNAVYFSIGQEICALDLQTQITRKVRVQESGNLELTGCYFDGTVLSCKLLDEQGGETALYLSAETGQTLSEDQNVLCLQTNADSYYAEHLDGYVLQRIFGTLTEIPQSLRLPEGTYDCVTPVLQHGGVLTYKAENDGIRFSFHDLSQGKTTAQMVLPQVEAPAVIASSQRYIWVIAAHAGTNKQVLYRWDTTMSAAQEEFAAVDPLYTAQSPDEDGLKLQQEHVDQYNEQYGVRIAIWENATAQTGEYSVVGEHQPSVISDMLTQLEPAFSLFPENFLRKTVEGGWIRIGLVRSIGGGSSWAQFWENGDCYILLTPEGYLSESFLQAVSYAVDTHVLGNSRDFDTWDTLNPEGFTYDYSYDVYADREDLSLTQGEERAFIDSLSMTYPHEDRCRVFYYAITQGNEEIFASPIMQNKLQKLCEGIREAYGLEQKEESFPWEQYLTQEMDFSYT